MERYYNIAGLDICIKGKDEDMYREERRLKAFSSEKKEMCYEYRFSIEEQLDKNSGICIYQDASKRIYQDGDKIIRYIGVLKKNIEGAYIRCESKGNVTHVQVKRKEIPECITSKVVLRALGIELLISKTVGFILHASFINVSGRAVLFTAPSGTGKSTQAELWRNLRGTEIINGDRAVIRIKDDAFEACGLPFAGSSEYCKNAYLPLAAIVYLEQAPETSIAALNGIQAFQKIWEQITIPAWDRDAVEQISAKLISLLAKIPVYHLACTPDESAVIALENKLKEEC